MSQSEIRCDGALLNPCSGLSDQEAEAAFRMYSGPQASKGHTFTLHRNGSEIARVQSPVKK